MIPTTGLKTNQESHRADQPVCECLYKTSERYRVFCGVCATAEMRQWEADRRQTERRQPEENKKR